MNSKGFGSLLVSGGLLRGVLGRLRDLFAASWGVLGASWERLGPSWGRLGPIVEACHLGNHFSSGISWIFHPKITPGNQTNH